MTLFWIGLGCFIVVFGLFIAGAMRVASDADDKMGLP